MDEPTRRAKMLRRQQTLAEGILWRQLRNRHLNGWKFRRQKPIAGYIVDFICVEAGLIIEVDGGQHQDAKVYDTERTRRLEAEGFKVLRFWNNEILMETAAVLEKILEYLPPHPNPLPEGERE